MIAFRNALKIKQNHSQTPFVTSERKKKPVGFSKKHQLARTSAELVCAQRSEVQARQPEAQPRPESLSTAVQGLGTAVYAAVYARGGATQLSSAIGASLTLVVILGCFCCRHCGKAAEAA
jgi:hypothetical protein